MTNYRKGKAMRKTISIIVVCIALQGCAFHYHNEKRISGKSGDIVTKVGNIDDARGIFKSTLDIWFPGRPKEDVKLD